MNQKFNDIIGDKKHILFLQGPMGPFFCQFSSLLKKSYGATITKINFNGGDLLFSPINSINYRGSIDEWPKRLEQIIIEKNIELIFLYGDCRPIHKIASDIANKAGIGVAVFEEGYIRPNYITLEKNGVNGYSQMPNSSTQYRNITNTNTTQKSHYFRYASFWMTVWAILYYVATILVSPVFKHYQHHRSLSLMDPFLWIRGIFRCYYYKYTERAIHDHLTSALHKNYFLVPLQVHNDSQVLYHSQGRTIHSFIETTIKSFSRYACPHHFLVIKHHPADRAYADYKKLITELAEKYHVCDRVFYIHDQHLPSLLSSAQGVITINSTVGLSSLFYNTPVKVLGTAIYDIQGLTYQGLLKSFWHTAGNFQMDRKLFHNFIGYLINHNQINDTFYSSLLFYKFYEYLITFQKRFRMPRYWKQSKLNLLDK